jgi:hypothetical protein
MIRQHNHPPLLVKILGKREGDVHEGLWQLQNAYLRPPGQHGYYKLSISRASMQDDAPTQEAYPSQAYFVPDMFKIQPEPRGTGPPPGMLNPKAAARHLGWTTIQMGRCLSEGLGNC